MLFFYALLLVIASSNYTTNHLRHVLKGEVAHTFAPLPLMFVPGLSGTGLLTHVDESANRCASSWIAESNVGHRTGTGDDVVDFKPNEWYRAWLSIDMLRPPASHQDCWFDVMKLVYNSPSFWHFSSLGTWTNPNGVEVAADPGLHGVTYLDYLAGMGLGPTKYYQDLIQGILTQVSRKYYRAANWTFPEIDPEKPDQVCYHSPYVRDVNITGFGYDWRLPVWQVNWDEFKRRVESSYARSFNRPVILISHSMGSLWLNYFFHVHATEAWKRKYVKAVISVNGANGGSFKAIRALLSGYSPVDLPLFDYLNLPQPLPMHKVRDLCRTFPAILSLIPNPNLYNQDMIVATIPSTDGAQEVAYSLKNWTDALDDQELAHRVDLVRTTLGDVGLIDPGVPYYCLYSVYQTENTEFSYTYTSLDKNPTM